MAAEQQRRRGAGSTEFNSDPFGGPQGETPEPEPDPQTTTGLLALLDSQANLGYNDPVGAVAREEVARAR